MSTTPLPRPSSQEAQERKKRDAARRSDLMYFAGAILETLGASLCGIERDLARGMIVAGFFLLLMPILELASSFVRGLRSNRGR